MWKRRRKKKDPILEAFDMQLTALQFLQATNWSESASVLEEHPELLSDEGEAALEALELRMLAENQRALAATTRLHRDLLQHARTHGVSEAFAANIAESDSKYAIGDSETPPLLLELAAHALFEQTTDELQSLLRDHPELLGKTGRDLFDFSIALAEEAGDNPQLRKWKNRVEVIRLASVIGVDAAFAEAEEQGKRDQLIRDSSISEVVDRIYSATASLGSIDTEDVSTLDSYIADWDAIIETCQQEMGFVPTRVLHLAGYPSAARYRVTKDAADLDRAGKLWERVVTRSDTDDETLSAVVPSLAQVYLGFDLTAVDPSARDKAIELLRQSLEDPRRVSTTVLVELAALLEDRRSRDGDVDAGNLAVGVARRVINRALRSGASETDKLSLLRLPRRVRAALAGDAYDAATSDVPPPELREPMMAYLETPLNRAATLLRDYAILSSEEAIHHVGALASLARLSGESFEAVRIDERRDCLVRAREVGVDAALTEFEERERAYPEIFNRVIEADSPAEALHGLNSHRALPAVRVATYVEHRLGDARAQFQSQGQEDKAHICDFKRAIVQSSLDGDHFLSSENEHRAHHQANFVLGEATQALRDQDRAHLDGAISKGRELVCDPQLADISDRFRAELLYALAGAHHGKFTLTGDETDLRTADELAQEAAALAPRGSQVWIDSTKLLIYISATATLESPDDEKFAAAIGHSEDLLTFLGSDHVDRPLTLYNYANALSNRSERNWEVQNRAVQMCEESIVLTDEDSEYLPSRLNGLGRFLRRRAKAEKSDMADMLRAVRVERRAMSMSSHGGSERPMLAASLGNCMVDLFEMIGDEHTLEESISCFEEVIADPASTASNRCNALTGYSRALLRRFEAHGVREDLEAARQAACEATEIRGIAPELGAYALIARATMASAVDHDLDGEIRLLEVAAGLAPKGSVAASVVQHNLASTLSARYALLGDDRDADAVLDLLEPGLREAKNESAGMALMLFGDVLIERYRWDSTRRLDLDRGIAALEEAAELVTDRVRLGVMSKWASGRVLRWRLDGNDKDRTEAELGFRSATSSAKEVGPTLAVPAAKQWAEWAIEREAWTEASEAAERGLRVVRNVVRDQLRRTAKEEWLVWAQSLPSLASYAHFKSGNCDEALMALEAGRALLLNEALERHRFDVEALEGTDDRYVAKRYMSAASRWAQLTRPDNGESQRPDGRALADARAELDSAIAELRDRTGLDVDPSATLDEVQAVATSEAVVYTAAAPAGGLALVLLPGGDVKAVDLPLFSENELGRRAFQWLGSYSGRLGDRQLWRATSDDVTRWLGEAVMGPALSAIPDGLPITLIPNGLLGLLPVHAAWKSDGGDGRRYLLDVAPIRYAPNARALLEARRRCATTSDQRLLAIEDPRPSSHVALPNAALEVDEVCRYFPNRMTTRLRKSEAQLQDTLDALKSSDVLHFCCHGSADRQPLLGGLDLADDVRLSVGTIMSHQLNARLAVLSACESALISSQLSNEMLGLPTAFLEAGAAGVVGSLWAVTEAATTAIISDFYARWRQGSADPADALCSAQAWARDATYEELHERFPSVDAFDPSGIGRASLRLWVKAKPLRQSADWAAMAFTGV
jgi:CHAT domain-containing protein